MPSNSSFPPLAAKHINISRHSFMLVKGAGEPSSEHKVLEPLSKCRASSRAAAFGALRPWKPPQELWQPSVRGNQASSTRCPQRLLCDTGPHPKVLPPSVPHRVLGSY